MAVKVFTEVPEIVHFADLEIGVRSATVQEMLQITELREEYIQSIRDSENGQGDLGLFFRLTEFVSKTLACDPENAKNPWFAQDKTEQDNFAKNQVYKNTADEVPQKMHQMVWDLFAKPLVQNDEAVKAGEDAPLETTPEETPSESTPSSSESQNISESTQAT